MGDPMDLAEATARAQAIVTEASRRDTERRIHDSLDRIAEVGRNANARAAEDRELAQTARGLMGAALRRQADLDTDVLDAAVKWREIDRRLGGIDTDEWQEAMVLLRSVTDRLIEERDGIAVSVSATAGWLR